MRGAIGKWFVVWIAAVLLLGQVSYGQTDCYSTTTVGDQPLTDIIKMPQPMPPDPQGWDVCFRQRLIADDFQCSENGPLTGIHFWVSWRDDIVDDVLDWDISIHADANGQPGERLWQFTEGTISLCEEQPSLQGWLCRCPDCDEDTVLDANHSWYALVNIVDIKDPFVQTMEATYWLVIRANATVYEDAALQTEVGWKTSTNTFGAPAMWSVWDSSGAITGWEVIADPTGTAEGIDMAMLVSNHEVTPTDLDFGDAPEDTSHVGGYATTLSMDGARHALMRDGVFLGMVQGDTEADGQPSTGADGDDQDTSGDDEDGVTFPVNPLTPGAVESIEVVMNPDCPADSAYLNAWIDFNADGDWDDRGEQIACGLVVHPGSNTVTFTVPLTNADYHQRTSYARFRLSSHEYLNHYGRAENGEVEDYMVTISEGSQSRLDFGDAPEGYSSLARNYPTTRSNNGARHIVNREFHLGRWIDAEEDGQPTLAADGDDVNGLNDDEDGVFMPTALTPGESIEIKVIASAEGMLDAWLDTDNNGDWDNTGEKVLDSVPLHAGVNYIPVAVPASLTSSTYDTEDAYRTYMRFRFSEQGGQNCYGPDSNTALVIGEVEDYIVTIEPQDPPSELFDFGDAPEDLSGTSGGYPTTLAANGARHYVRPDIFLGNPLTDVVHIDAEPDGQPTLPADGDDMNGVDDEDGVTFPSPLVPGLPGKVEVLCSVPSTGGFLDAWIDFNSDGDWDDFGERIFASEPVSAGVNNLVFHVPPYPEAVPTNEATYARFRLSTHGHLDYKGPARDGEVEDYTVRIEEPQRGADLGDAPDSSNNYGATMTAYPIPGGGVQANFPTVYNSHDPGCVPGPIHHHPREVAFLGAHVSGEEDADFGFDEDPTNNLIPPRDLADLDEHDDALAPIDSASELYELVLPPCRETAFEYVVRVVSPIDKLFVNVWFDWNRDGDWDDMLRCPQPNPDTAYRGQAPEWAVQNQLLTRLGTGIHRIKTPPFKAWHPKNQDGTIEPQPVWMRITLSESPWEKPAILCVGTGGSGPKRGYKIGETEDYLIEPIIYRNEFADLDGDERVDLNDLAALVSQWLTVAPVDVAY